MRFLKLWFVLLTFKDIILFSKHNALKTINILLMMNKLKKRGEKGTTEKKKLSHFALAFNSEII